MRNKLTVFILVLGVAAFALLFGRQAYLNRGLPYAKFNDKKLKILTYSTFAGANGPLGPIIDDFKRHCSCDMEVFFQGDAGFLVESLRLANAAPVDVVIGFDQLALSDAETQLQWKDIPFDKKVLRHEMMDFKSDHFVPFDWSPMSFIYRQGEATPPRDFDELLLPRFKNQFALQDPRASSAGLQFFDWVKSVEGKHTVDFLTRFKANVQSVSPSWAFSYGLFKKKQATFVFSYLTSLAYHWGLEKDRSYQAVFLAEGHPLQVEFAAVPANCRECDLAAEFVRDLLSARSQKLIMEKNYMLPVIQGIEAGTVFAELPQMKIRKNTGPKAKDLSDWDKVFKR